MHVHIDDIYDLIIRTRMKAEEDELTADEALDILEKEFQIIEIES